MARREIDPVARGKPGAHQRLGTIRYGKATGVLIDSERYPIDWVKCGSAGNARVHWRRGEKLCERCAAFEASRTNRRRRS